MVENTDNFGLKTTKSTMLLPRSAAFDLLFLDGRTGILRHDLTLQDTHPIFNTRLPSTPIVPSCRRSVNTTVISSDLIAAVHAARNPADTLIHNGHIV